MTTPRTPVEPPSYRLEHEPDGRSWTARENLADILERELLGPANGPEEVLDGAPDSAYLIGRIAPVKLTARHGRPDGRGHRASPIPTSATPRMPQAEPGVPVTAVDDSGAGADEDSGVEDEPQQRGLMIPASMGLRCQIPDDLESFTVIASWGVYEPVHRGGPEPGRGSCAGTSAPRSRSPSDQGRRPPRVGDHGDPAQGQGRAAGGPARRSRARLPADRDRAVQRPGDAAEDPGQRLAVPDQADRVTAGERGVPAGQRPAAGHPRRAGRRAAAAEPAVPGPAGVRGRPHLLGGLGGRPGGAAGQQGVDDVAADVRDAAGRRRGDRRALLDMRELAAASPEQLRAGWRRSSSGYAAWLDGEEARARALPEHLRAEGAGRGQPRHGRCSASSPTGWSICWPTPRRCAASGS